MKLGGLLVAWFCGVALIAQGAERKIDNWPTWRGLDRTNISHETGLLQRWGDGGPTLLWKAGNLGEGFSSVSVVNDVVLTMGNRNGQEQVIALDALDEGRELWSATIGPVRFDGAGYPGPRSSPTYDSGRVYAIGLNGDLVCLAADDGKLIWRRDLVGDFGGKLPTWGYAESALVDGPWLLCTPGGGQATIVALDKRSGQTVWESPIGDTAGYSSIITIEPDGLKQYAQFTAQGLIGVRAHDGKFLWRYAAPANGTANISTPVADKNLVFAASGYGTGGGLARITVDGQQATAEEAYFTKNMKNHHGGMVLLGGYLYGSNDPGMLTCLEFSTGKSMWSDRATGKCAIVCADGHIYARSEEGKVSLVEATPAEFRLKGQFEQPDRSNQPSWPHPVIADGRLYLRDQTNLLCYAVRSGEGS